MESEDPRTVISELVRYRADCGCYVTSDHVQHISPACMQKIHDVWGDVIEAGSN